MASEVMRVDKQLKEEIKKLQIELEKQTGKWISQAEALRKLLKNEIQ